MKVFTQKEVQLLLDKLTDAKNKLQGNPENSLFDEHLLKVLKESWECIFSLSKGRQD